MDPEEKTDLIAEVVGHRFCLRPEAVRRWMDKNQVYELNDIIELSKNFEKFLSEIIAGGDSSEVNKNKSYQRLAGSRLDIQ